MKPQKSTWRKPFGVLLIILGVAGLFLPLVPGILLIALGIFFWEAEI